MNPGKVRPYLQPARLRAAFWALRARRIARRAVWAGDLTQPVEVPRSPAVSAAALPAVLIVLGYTRATCLVRSLVLQRWFGDHGEVVDVVIGVTAPGDGFRAHAWLDRPGEFGDGYTEVHRLPGNSPGRSGSQAIMSQRDVR